MDDYNPALPADAFPNALTEDRTVAALFDSRSEAESAHDALKTAGFTAINISRKPDDTPATDETRSGLWEEIKAFFTGHHHDAGVYGEGVRRGKTLVTVQVPETRSDEVNSILSRFNPIDIDTYEKAWREDGWTGESVTAVGDMGRGHNRAAGADEPGIIPDRDNALRNLT